MAAETWTEREFAGEDFGERELAEITLLRCRFTEVPLSGARR